MSDLSDIYQLRSQLENGPTPITVGHPLGIAGALQALEFTVLTRANAPAEFQQARPRVELKCQIGAATGKKDYRASDQQMAFSAWRFTVALQAITAPDNDGVSQLHEEYLGKLRKAMNTLAQSSWDDLTNFPNLLIAEPLKDSGTQSNLKTSEGVEYSVLSYDGIVMVRPGTW